MAITADDKYLFTSDIHRCDLKQFRVSDGRLVKHYLRLFENGIGSMITTPDSNFFFASSEGKLKQICLESQEVVHDYGQTHDSGYCILQTTRDSKYLMIGGPGNHVKRISIENRAVETDFGQVCDRAITAMKISADETKIFLGEDHSNLKLISLTDGTIIKDFGNVHNYGEINGIVMTADEKFFFTSSRNGRLKQWNYGDTTLVVDYRQITGKIHCLCL
jgi:WD40 repeat protein